MTKIKVYDNYPALGLVPSRVASQMIAAGAPKHIRQFDLLIAAPTKAAAIQAVCDLDGGRIFYRTSDLRLAMGNRMAALREAGELDRPRILAYAMYGTGGHEVIDVETGNIIGSFTHALGKTTFTRATDAPTS